MATRLCTAAVVVAMTFAAMSDGLRAQAGLSASMFCGWDLSDVEARRKVGTPKLYPRDEAGRDPAFASFLRDLLDAVKRRDVEAILRVTDPNFRLDFGGGDGIEYLKLELDRPDTYFWEEFPRALALGGTFTDYGFAAPYVYSVGTGGDCSAIIGAGVRLRERPDRNSRVVTLLAYDIVQAEYTDDDRWRHVRTASGLSGFVASQYVRSGMDHRAVFQKKNGRWWLTAFVAGD